MKSGTSQEKNVTNPDAFDTNPQTTSRVPEIPAVPNGSSSLSPPHTWSESSETADEENGESRHLFTVLLSMPDAKILNANVISDSIDRELLVPGAPFLPRLLGKAPWFLLNAATTSHRQRLFARVKCGRMSQACELLCEFESSRARVTALALRSAYGPSTPFHSLTFTTKHCSSCALTHVDYTSIPYLGHLPTDLVGRSILSLIYAPDVHVVRQAHIDLHNSRGKVVKSVAPLRFVAYNGALLTTESEWSAYVNPWTKRIEMVVARHRIIGAPVGDANVLLEASQSQPVNVLPPVMAKTFEDELRSLMNKPVSSCCTRSSLLPSTTAAVLAPTPSDKDNSASADRSDKPAMCQSAAHATKDFHAHAASTNDLTAYIDRLVETLVVASNNNTQTTTPTTPPPQAIPVQLEACTLAGKQGEVPLSYTQINCLENVKRLLKSQSRQDLFVKSETSEENNRASPQSSIPLTRAALMQHTKRYEEEYRDTWNRRLKRVSVDALHGSPSPKNMRPSTSSTPPSNWTPAQREEYYRSLAPNPPPPPGKNYQITSVPLSPPDVTPPSQSPSSVERQSAFTAVKLKALPLRDLPQPLALSIHDSVIQSPMEVTSAASRGLLLPASAATNQAFWSSRSASIATSQPIKLATDALLMLHDSA